MSSINGRSQRAEKLRNHVFGLFLFNLLDASLMAKRIGLDSHKRTRETE
jgi:hypothetical protein